MNILFANYGDFRSNSLNHIAPFAARLAELGHDCMVAVPSPALGLDAIPAIKFTACSQKDYLAGLFRFKDGRGPDIIHAWTPRDSVRRFVLDCLRREKSRLVVHLEDNEDYLSSLQMNVPEDSLLAAEHLPKADLLPAAISHPIRQRLFLGIADGVTYIIPSLRQKAPDFLPSLELPPGVDRSLYRPQAPDPALRSELGIAPDEQVLVFTGSNTFANEEEVRDLYIAVSLLNERGLPTRLVRTGHFTSAFTNSLPAGVLRHVVDLGFVAKEKLPALLALASAVVQPGRPGPFNDFRLPSKIPEILAMGVPLILPASNAGLELRDGEEAVVLGDSSPEEIADACQRLFSDPSRARRIGEGGLAFSQRRYDLATNTSHLESFYRKLLAEPQREEGVGALRPDECEAGLWLRTKVLEPLANQLPSLTPEVVAYIRHQLSEDYSASLLAGLRYELARQEKALEAARRHAESIRAAAEARAALTDQHVKNLEGIIAGLKEEGSALRSELAAQQRVVESLNNQVTALGNENAARADKITRMQASASWKLTAPLRWLRRLHEKSKGSESDRSVL